MANRIVQFHKLGKHNSKRTDMNTNLLTVPFSISFCHNKYNKNIDMKLKPSGTTTMSSTNTYSVHKKKVSKFNIKR